MSIKPVSLKPALIVGTGVAVVAMSLGIYFIRQQKTPDQDSATSLKKILIVLAVAAALGLVAGGLLHNVLFSFANPEIAAANYAISSTRQALFGR